MTNFLATSGEQVLISLLGAAAYTLYLYDIARRRRIFWLWTVLVGVACGLPLAYLCLALPLRWLHGDILIAAVWPGLLISPLPALLGLLWVWFIPAYDAAPLTSWERLGRAGWPVLKTILLLPWTIVTLIMTPRGVRPRDWWGDTGAGSLADGWDPTLSSQAVPGLPAEHAGPDPPMSVCPFCGAHN